MIETFFLTVNQWMTGGAGIALLGCFIWGMVSVMFSPCHLASIPLIVAYVAGQEKAVDPRQAGWYAGAFTLGLFITIALIGIACALMGRMLGDIGIWWQVLVGGVLIWVAMGMLGVEACSMSGSLLYRLNLQRSSRRIRAGPCLRCSVRIMHIRVHRSDTGHSHRPATDPDRDSDDYAVCAGALPADCCGRQFNSSYPQADGKQVMAGRRQLVP